MLPFIFVFCILLSHGQQGLDMGSLEIEADSAQLELERKMLYQQLIDGHLNAESASQPLQLPEFNYKNEMVKRWNIDISGLSAFQNTISGFSPLSFNYSMSPYFRNGAVFSSASYQINDKFTLGGYSFGANTIFSAPLPNQGMNNFDTRGSTLFMQYKVSKKFKIETRVSVSQGPGPGY